MGTNIIYDHAKAVVCATGMNNEFDKITIAWLKKGMWNLHLYKLRLRK